MDAASVCHQLFGTIELVELILEYIPLYDLLRMRQVSRTWRELIERSKPLRSVRDNPCIGVQVRLPVQCSLSEGETPMLEADLQLLHERPVTVLRSPSCLSYSRQIFFKYEEGTAAPETLPLFTWGGCFRARALRFNHVKADKWVTLYPGRPFTIRWPFRAGQFGSIRATDGNLGGAESGKRYTLELRSGMGLMAYVGTKEWLLARLEEGDKKAKSLRSFKIANQLRLAGENQVHFEVIP